MPKKTVEIEDTCDFEDDGCLINVELDDEEELDEECDTVCSCCGQSLNSCACVSESESAITTEVRGIIDSAIYSKSLPELSHSEKEELIEYILNDDEVWAEFDNQIGSIFSRIKEKGMNSIRDLEPPKLRCPIKYSL